jgi:hypothetical protein
MAEEILATRLVNYAKGYALDVWDLEVEPTVADLERMALRIDGWANAHVESGCPCGHTPEECGEANAAAEWVETQ